MDSEQENVKEALIARDAPKSSSMGLKISSFNLDAQRTTKAHAAYGAFDAEESRRVHDAYVVAPENTELHGAYCRTEGRGWHPSCCTVRSWPAV